MSDLKPRLRPGLEPAEYAAVYEREGWVQIPDLLPVDVAEEVAQILETKVQWSIMVTDPNGKTHIIDRKQYEENGAQRINEYLRQMTQRAGENFAFLHMTYSLLDEYPRDPGHPIARMAEFLNSAEFLDFGRAVIGAPSVKSSSVMASRYGPGDFLTLHDDSHTKDIRRAAMTLGFTRRWRPDWGGQLLFHDAAGDVERGLAPGFNVLTLFKVPKPHSVAFVAPYAKSPRLSITGWLRDDPSLVNFPA
ncbi:2OG-Fe(II) oxygenase [Caulobacter sp. NIBR2454]|uniref:2OG-Fe(II) oxygenase n=1 Tax=Caulobacter sp. NIBR2454 TaxID=3015996 RepID=UPI0022B71708|nr:2OG-Fe(II) oxygenase family protein [Caulobacter sp. NIBR2454]